MTLNALQTAEVFDSLKSASPSVTEAHLLSHVTTICFMDGPQVLVCRDDSGFYIGSAFNTHKMENAKEFAGLSYPIAFSRVGRETLDAFFENRICLRTACTQEAHGRVLVTDLKNSKKIKGDHGVWFCIGQDFPLHEDMLAEDGIKFSDIEDLGGISKEGVYRALGITG